MDCSRCGGERPDRGTCKKCGSRLCCKCRVPLEAGRGSWVCKPCDRLQTRQRRDKAPERYRESGRRAVRKWQSDNAGKVSEKVRKWQSENPEKVADQRHRRRAKKKGCVVTSAAISEVIQSSGGVCVLCRTYVPEGLRHIDHIVPLDKGGPHSQNNLQLLCYRCNTSKGAKLPEEVVPETWVKKPRPDQPFLLNPNWR